MNDDRDRQFLEKRKKQLRDLLWGGIIGMVLGVAFAAAFYIWVDRRYEEVADRSRSLGQYVETMNRKALETLAVKRDKSRLKLVEGLCDGISLFILVVIPGLSLMLLLSYRTEKRYLEVISRLQEDS